MSPHHDTSSQPITALEKMLIKVVEIIKHQDRLVGLAIVAYDVEVMQINGHFVVYTLWMSPCRPLAQDSIQFTPFGSRWPQA